MAWTLISGDTVNLINVNAETCGDECISIENMMSTPMSGITSLKEFKDTMVSELIDAKSWKTQPSYPTLRLVYDRYMNSTKYCDTQSAQFDYCDMIQFSELVGTYWVDLIEQVVPATTIWGSTYVFGNTFWDQQKFQYKKYTLFGCNLPVYEDDVLSPTTGWTTDVQLEWETLPNDPYYDEISGSTTGETFANVRYQRAKDPKQDPKDNECQGVGIIQMNSGSEFIGKVVDYRTPTDDGDGGDVVISECAITVDIIQDGDYYTANVSGDVVGPLTYLWSNGATTQTTTGLNVYDYGVTVYDNGVEGCEYSRFYRRS